MKQRYKDKSWIMDDNFKKFDRKLDEMLNEKMVERIR